MKISTHTLTWSVTLSHAVPHVPHKISTHTLTWSVTSAEIDQLQTEKISTHTLTWSVTALIVHRTPLLVFQLTRSRGA